VKKKKKNPKIKGGKNKIDPPPPPTVKGLIKIHEVIAPVGPIINCQNDCAYILNYLLHGAESFLRS